jgi:hypothetical protein
LRPVEELREAPHVLNRAVKSEDTACNENAQISGMVIELMEEME